MSVKGSSYSSQCVDSTEWLQTSITCDIWMYERDLFFITKTSSLEAVVKEESMNYPPGTTGPCRESRKGKGKREAHYWWRWDWETGRTPGDACDPAHRRRSLCPVNWNTKQSRVDERVVRTRRGEKGGKGGTGAAVCLQQRSTFTARWELTGEPASETDTLSLVKWTVTLHFSASWQHRIGCFEPCDVTLIEFWFPPPLGSKRKKPV